MVLVPCLLDIRVLVLALVTNGRLVGAILLVYDDFHELVIEQLAFLLFRRLG